jgi:cytoskeletal protein CcmA (bactofilin family)
VFNVFSAFNKNMRSPKILIGLIIALFVALFSVGIARAADTLAELQADQTINGIYIRAADKILIKGTVQGDVIVAGGDVEIDGSVKGSVYAVAEKVVVKGRVAGNIHVAGADVEVSSQDSASVFLAGSTVQLGEQASIQNLFAAGGELSIRGDVDQSIYVAGTEVVIAGKTGGDVAVAGEKITVQGSSEIGGNLNYSSQNQVAIENDRSIQGSIKRAEPDRVTSTQERIMIQLVDLVYWLIANILIAGVLLYIAPKLFFSTATGLNKRLFYDCLKAVALVVIVPIVLILMLFTIIGIPLAAVMALLFILVLVMAPTASAHFIGGMIMERLKPNYKKTAAISYATELVATIIGFVTLAVVGLVPVLGVVISLMAFILGVALISGRGMDILRSERTKEISIKPSAIRSNG